MIGDLIFFKQRHLFGGSNFSIAWPKRASSFAVSGP
jgi:hypothetical protein